MVTEVDQSYNIARDQWEQINVIPIIDLSRQEINNSSSIISINFDKVSTVDCFEEVDTYYRELDLSQFSDKITPAQRYSIWKRVLFKLPFCRISSLRKDLLNDRDHIFSIALYPFDNSDSWHYRFLVTIYRRLTRSVSCPRLGNHWEVIGFQGNDPATDLRGVGMFGIYQLLYFVLSPDRESLVHDIYSLSQDPIQEFPFAAMSTNITQIVLQVLRSGRLNKHLNKQSNLFKSINDFYCDLYYQLFKIWKTENKTIKDAGFVLKEIRLSCKKKINLILRSSQNYENVKDEGMHSKDQLVEFSSIGNVFD